MSKKSIKAVKIILSIGIISTLLMSENVIASPGWIIVSPLDSNYYEGDSVLIGWSYSFDSGNWVKIELYMGASLYSTIDYNTSNDGSYLWTIPSGYASPSQYRIKVTSLSNSSIYGYSGYFYIYNKHITVTSPSGGETWFGGEGRSITWESENVGNYVEIEYKVGSSLYTITSNTYNYGSYYWVIPDTLYAGSNYQIKVTSTSDPDTYGYSNYFSIGKRSITITSPAGGETWYRGEKNTIRWTSENAGSTVNIYYRSGPYYYYYTVVTSANNDGVYEWSIPGDLTLNSQYQIKISSAEYSSVYDESAYFNIDERYIIISSPGGSDKWYPNETYTITWDTKNAGNHVSIRLLKNGAHCAWISSDTDNTGTYAWTIPSIFSADSDYTIEIRSKNFSSVYDYSDDFSIGGRTITITSPKSDETWYKGDSYSITWESENAGNTVIIDLYKNGVKYRTIESNANNQGNYSWKIPDDLPTGSSYQIKVTSSTYSDVYALSSGNITMDESLLQKATLPLVLVVTFVVLLVVAYIIFIKFRKKMSKKEEKTVNQPQFLQPSKDQISQDEYDNIWEKKIS